MMAAFFHDEVVKACARRACNCPKHQEQGPPGAAANEAHPPDPAPPPVAQPPVADSGEVVDAQAPDGVAGDGPGVAPGAYLPPVAEDVANEQAADVLPAVVVDSEVADGVIDAGSSSQAARSSLPRVAALGVGRARPLGRIRQAGFAGSSASFEDTGVHSQGETDADVADGSCDPAPSPEPAPQRTLRTLLIATTAKRLGQRRRDISLPSSQAQAEVAGNHGDDASTSDDERISKSSTSRTGSEGSEASASE